MSFARKCGNFFTNTLCTIIGAMLLLVVWFYQPQVVLDTLNFNLWVIHYMCSFVPAGYGAAVEAALRGALGAEKALLFFEAGALVKICLVVTYKIMRIGHKKKQYPVRAARV